jgi:hypothetical protein
VNQDARPRVPVVSADFTILRPDQRKDCEKSTEFEDNARISSRILLRPVLTRCIGRAAHASSFPVHFCRGPPQLGRPVCLLFIPEKIIVTPTGQFELLSKDFIPIISSRSAGFSTVIGDNPAAVI